MRSPFYRRFATWLCLLACLGLAITPTRAFVLCVRASGEVSLEAALAGRCANCGDVCCGTQEEEPEQDCEACCVESIPSAHADRDCTCIDVALPSQADASSTPPQVRSAAAEIPVAILDGEPAPPRASLFPTALLPNRPLEHPPPDLRGIRSVVLLI